MVAIDPAAQLYVCDACGRQVCSACSQHIGVLGVVCIEPCVEQEASMWNVEMIGTAEEVRLAMVAKSQELLDAEATDAAIEIGECWGLIAAFTATEDNAAQFKVSAGCHHVPDGNGSQLGRFYLDIQRTGALATEAKPR